MNKHQIDDIRNFYELHRHELYTYALSILASGDHAEDAVHNAFAQILRKRKAPKELRPYIFRCVRNAAIDELRFASRRNGNAILFDPQDPMLNADNAMMAREVEELLLTLDLGQIDKSTLLV